MSTGWDVGSVGFALLPLLVLLLIVVVVVAFTRRTLADGTAALTPRRLVEGYVFTVLLVAMLLVSSGLADVVRAGIASYTGLESSYRPRPVYDEGERKPDQAKFEYDKDAPRRDLLGGIAQLAVGVVMGLTHLFGLRRLGHSEAVTLSPVYRIFLIVGLVIYTAATLVFAVSAVEDFLVYRYVGGPPKSGWDNWYKQPVPGEQLAGLIGFLPLWGLLVVRLFRYAQPRGDSS